MRQKGILTVFFAQRRQHRLVGGGIKVSIQILQQGCGGIIVRIGLTQRHHSREPFLLQFGHLLLEIRILLFLMGFNQRFFPHVQIYQPLLVVQQQGVLIGIGSLQQHAGTCIDGQVYRLAGTQHAEHTFGVFKLQGVAAYGLRTVLERKIAVGIHCRNLQRRLPVTAHCKIK